MDVDEDSYQNCERQLGRLTLYLIETSLNTFEKKQSKPRSGSSHKSCLMFAYNNIIRYDPTPMDVTSNFFNLCTNVDVYLHDCS